MNESGVELVSLVRNIKESGPARVVVDGAGLAVGYREALAKHKAVPTVIFIRDDGWTLGAPYGLIEVAMKLWENEWVAVLKISNGHVYSYSAFRQEWNSTERC